MSKELSTLFDILSVKRPYGGMGDERIIEQYLDVIPKMQKDGFGNRILTVGKHPSVMFSCHTDTVHRGEGTNALFLDEARQEVFNTDGSCLGADDGAGMWLMLQMIKAGKRGLYVFHRGEECGGLGSDWIAGHTPELLDGIKYCIALDRKGDTSVITHQFSGEGCSNTFAVALSGALGMGFEPDPTGIFTDSDNYTHIIPECTNLSVGYYSEHTAGELLDYGFLQRLSDKLRRISFETLPVERDPDTAVDYYGGYTGMANYGSYGQWPTSRDLEEYDRADGRLHDDSPPWDEHDPFEDCATKVDPDISGAGDIVFDVHGDAEFDEMYTYICNHPLDVTDLLLENGFTPKILKEKGRY